MIPANDLFDAFNKASIADPQAHILAVAFTLTWLRIQREIAAEGIPWEDAVCLCFPTAIDVTGLVVGFNWTDDPRIAAVRARWDSTEAVGDGLGAAMAALGVELERTTDEEVGEGLYGLALAAEMWREAAELAKAADSPAKARTALLTVFAAVEIRPNEDGFPISFMGHGEILDDGSLSMDIPPMCPEPT